MLKGNYGHALTKRMLFLIVAVLFVVSLAVPIITVRSADASTTWQGEYWNLPEGQQWSGTIPGGDPQFTQNTSSLDFDWSANSPDDSINDDFFAARWTSTQYIQAGAYIIALDFDDDIRITIDGTEVHDTSCCGPRDVFYNAETSGAKEIVVEYFEREGDARASFALTRPASPPPANELIGQDDFTERVTNTVSPNNYGFEEPFGLAVDTVNHRLIVADSGSFANRIMVFNLNSSNELVDKTADYVIGQSSFDERSVDCDEDDVVPTAATLCEPSGMEVDEENNRLFVADMDNNRVLVYDLDNLATGMSATHVLGQDDFAQKDCSRDPNEDQTEANTLCDPMDVAYDETNDRLFVADEENSRILAYDVAPNEISNGMDATGVLGQNDFTDDCDNQCSSVGADTLNYPDAVDYDEGSSRLIVADTSNSRVLIYNLNDGLTNGENAQTVLGQADFTSDCNDRCDVPAINTLDYPSYVHYDPDMDMLFISDDNNNRVVVYDDNGDGLGDISNGADFDYVLGQADFSGEDADRNDTESENGLDDPKGLITIPGTNRLFVADDDNDRLIIYDIAAITNGESAHDVVGQMNFLRAEIFGVGRISGRGLNSPSDVIVDTKHNRVFVADTYNGRVLSFDTDDNGSPIDATADGVIGQPDFISYVNEDDTGCPEATASNLCTPRALAYDEANDRLFVADQYHNRVTVYAVNPDDFENGMDATHVIGQENFTSSNTNQGGSATSETLYNPTGADFDPSSGRLYIADRANSRVLGYDVAPGTISNGMEADRIIGQNDHVGQDCNFSDSPSANSLCVPNDVAIDSVNNRLFISDNGNNRVVVHELGEDFEDGQDAVTLLGQSDWDESDCSSTTRSSMCYPSGIVVDGTNEYVYIVSNEEDRIIRYNLEETYPSDAEGDLLYGQYSWTMDECNIDDTYSERYLSEYSLCEPRGITVNQETGQLWAADYGNHRVLGFGDPVTQEDQDQDGISDEEENAGPNNGDANNDGTLDSEQGYVASFVNSENGQYVAVVVDAACTITAAGTASEASLSVTDPAFAYSAGLVNFTADCGTPGYTTTVTIFQYGLSKDGLRVRKHNPTTSAFFTVSEAVMEQTTIDGKTVTTASFDITDGELLDTDGEANGSIVDPVGLASQSVGSPDTGFNRIR